MTPGELKSVKFKSVLAFFHLENMRNASTEEAMFLHALFRSIAR